jgi:hypothetical protein
MARSFNSGLGQHLIHNAAVVAAEPLTMACWFSTDNVGITQTLISICTSGGAERWQLEIGGAALGNALAIRKQGSALNAVAVAGNPSNNVLHHAVGIYASATSRFCGLDGALGAENQQDAGSIAAPNRTLIAARINTTTGLFLNGLVAEVGIWKAALNADEAAALARGFSPLLVRPTALVAYWPLLGRSDPEICPKGGFNLTLTNGPTTGDHPRLILPRRRAA